MKDPFKGIWKILKASRYEPVNHSLSHGDPGASLMWFTHGTKTKDTANTHYPWSKKKKKTLDPAAESSLSGPIQTFRASIFLCKSVKIVSDDDSVSERLKIDPLYSSLSQKSHSTLLHSSTSNPREANCSFSFQGTRAHTLLRGLLIRVALDFMLIYHIVPSNWGPLSVWFILTAAAAQEGKSFIVSWGLVCQQGLSFKE